MITKSFLMTNSQHLVALELIVNVFEKKYNYTLVNVTDERLYNLREYVHEADPMMPFSVLDEVINFRQNASDDASVYLLRTDSEVCGIISVQDD